MNIIDGFKLTFKDGEVIDFEAAQGEAVLRDLLNTDDGAKRLGEVALNLLIPLPLELLQNL